VAESALPPVTSGARDHVVSVRLTAEESAYLDQLTTVHVTDRSSMIRHLILSAPLWRLAEIKPLVVDITPDPMLAACLCDLIDTSLPGGPPEYVRGRSNGCLRHQVPGEVSDAEARRKAREA
jgi:hypothetical protein